MLGARFKAIASPTLSPARLGERDEGLFVGRFARHFTPYIVCSLYSGWQFVTRTTHDPLRSKLSLRPMDSSSRSSRPHQVKVSLLSTWSWMDWGKSRHSLERMASFSMRRLLSLSTVGRMLLCFVVSRYHDYYFCQFIPVIFGIPYGVAPFLMTFN